MKRSRSPVCIVWPCPLPKTWVSVMTCWIEALNDNSRIFAKGLSSWFYNLKPFSYVRRWTGVKPMPPPPDIAFSVTGKPISSAARTAIPSSCTSPWVPGKIGTLAFWERSRATCLTPKASMISGDGLAQPRPASLASLAKWAFSKRNLYPGMMASAFSCFAISMITFSM